LPGLKSLSGFESLPGFTPGIMAWVAFEGIFLLSSDFLVCVDGAVLLVCEEDDERAAD
jgi:hypothetical protein